MFAALNHLNGKILPERASCHWHQERLKFPKIIDSSIPSEVNLHLILANHASH
jgi:putative transposase